MSISPSSFFCELPEEDRRYLRVDVTRRDLVERRTTELDSGRVDRLVAVADDEIVADGSLELQGHGWGDSIGEIRLMVARPYQHLGLGTLLARELYYLGMQHKLDRIVVRVMRPQSRAHRIMKRLGFKEEFLIPEHVRDQDGDLAGSHHHALQPRRAVERDGESRRSFGLAVASVGVQELRVQNRDRLRSLQILHPET